MAFKYNQFFCFFIAQFTCKLKNKENTAIIHNTNLQFQSECFGYSLELQNAISGKLYIQFLVVKIKKEYFWSILNISHTKRGFTASI